MKKVAEFIVEHPALFILLVILFTVIAGMGYRNIQVESDILKYLPQNDPAVKKFNQISEKFKGSYLGMVIIETENVFTTETLKKIAELTSLYQEIEGVKEVTSLTNIMDIKKTEEGLEISNLVDEIPESSEELERLKEYVLSKGMYKGNVVSEDGRLTAIICRIAEDADKAEVAKRIRRITEEHARGYTVHYAGLPLQVLFIEELVKKEIFRLIPIAIVVLLLVLGLLFGSFADAGVALSGVALSAVWIIGLFGLLGKKITVISDIIPVLLLAVGSAYGIHVIHRYNEERERTKEKKSALRIAIENVGIPVLMAGVTTLIGFLSLVSSDLTIIKDFGIFTAIGILFALFLALFFLPHLLSGKKKKKTTAPWVKGFLDRVADFVIRQRIKLIAGFLIIAFVAVIGIPRITREVNLVDYFPRSHPLREAEEIMEQKLGGSLPLQIVIESDDIKNPGVLKVARYIEESIKKLPIINNPQSIADLICEENELLNGWYSIPKTREGVGNLWFLLEGQPALEMMVDDEERSLQIQAKLTSVKTSEGKKAVNTVNEIINSIPDTLVYVSLIKRDSFLFSYKLSWFIKMVTGIAENRGMKIDTAVLKEKLLPLLIKKENTLPGNVEKRIENYLCSEEAEILLPRYLAKRIAKNIIKLNRKEEIKSLLEKEVSNIEKDPEMIEMLSSSLFNIIEEERQRVYFDKIWKKVKEELKQLLKDSDSRKRMKGMVYELVENTAVVDVDSYKKIKKDVEDQVFFTLKISQTGIPVIYKKLDEKLLVSQIQSIVIALVAVFLLMAVEFHSFVIGLVSVIPILFAIIINFGIMGWFGISLDNVTMAVSAIAIGIGIDYTIHIFSRYKRERAKGKDVVTALEHTMENTGHAVFINALSVASGFLVLLFSVLVPLKRFGLLLALTMFSSSIAAVLFLPSIILMIGVKNS